MFGNFGGYFEKLAPLNHYFGNFRNHLASFCDICSHSWFNWNDKFCESSFVMLRNNVKVWS